VEGVGTIEFGHQGFPLRLQLRSGAAHQLAREASVQQAERREVVREKLAATKHLEQHGEESAHVELVQPVLGRSVRKSGGI
jgi:hypothetical protein